MNESKGGGFVWNARWIRDTAKPGLWTGPWTDWNGDDQYQFSEAEKSDN